MTTKTTNQNHKFELFKLMLGKKQLKKENNPFGFSIRNQLDKILRAAFSICTVTALSLQTNAQITLLQDYQNYTAAPIGTFQNINFTEAGFSGLTVIPGTNGTEFWTVSDRGVNIDAANANPSGCHPTYDKIYAFPSYAPKMHRIKINGDSIQVLQTYTLKRPDGSDASGIFNPTGLGSTLAEVPSTDTVLNCADFSLKTTSKDTFGIDSEGIVRDKQGNFWICEEGGPTIWKVSPTGLLLNRFTPYANLPGVQGVDIQIDTVFKYRKNNRGFEGIAMAPNGKIYAIIQSPILYPTKTVGENTRVHRIIEIDPSNNATKMFAYLNDGIIGASGADQIRLRDWKIGDMVAVNDSMFLVLEAALRGITDSKRMYLININQATNVNSGLYSGLTLEALIDSTGLANNGIVPVKKTLFMDLLANGWPAVLDKAEGLTIINDSTIAIGNDNDYGQYSPLENGIATATGKLSHVFIYKLEGANKIPSFKSVTLTLSVASTNVSCNGGNNGSVNLTVADGVAPYTYNWSNGSTDEDLTGLAAGTYSVVVTDANGISNSISVTITQPTALAVSIVPQPATCGANIGFATANPTGGTPYKVPTNPTYTYLWSDGRTLKSIGGLLPGTYTVTVTDSLGCSVSNSTVILGSAITSVNTSAVKTTCGLNNGQACVNSITGGNAPYTYSWNTVPVQTTACATGLAKGNYEVTITTADGCIFYQTVKVGAYKPLGVYILSSTCTKAKAQPINGIYPFTYLWSNGATTKQASGLTNGTYTVTVTDGNNCSATVSVTIGCSARELAANTEIETNFTVSPNPVVDQFNVLFNASANGNATLKITDISGRIVKAESLEVINGENVISIDAADLTAGVYSVTLITGNEIYTQKLIKK